MKKAILIGLMMAFAVSAEAQVSAGIKINDEGVKSFYLAIGQTYQVPEREVVVVHERKIPDEEIPVVFFLARRAHVRPQAIIDLRLSGKSWMDITLHYHLRPSIFYVQMAGDPGPEYGRAYGCYKRPRNEWSRIRLQDDDIVKMVNLQFVSTHYRVKPEEVVRLRGQQGNFVRVVHVVSAPDYHRGNERAEQHGKSHDRGHGNGGDKGRGHTYGDKDDDH